MGKSLLPILGLGAAALLTGGLAAPAAAGTAGAGGVAGAAGTGAMGSNLAGVAGLGEAATAATEAAAADGLVGNAFDATLRNPEYFMNATGATPIFTGHESLPFLEKAGNVANQFGGGMLGDGKGLKLANTMRGMLQQPQQPQGPAGGGGGVRRAPAQQSQPFSPPYGQSTQSSVPAEYLAEIERRKQLLGRYHG